MKAYKVANPVPIAFLGANAVMVDANYRAELLAQPRLDRDAVHGVLIRLDG